MINKDFASTLQPAQQAQLQEILNNPLLWAESTFPPKVKLQRWQDINGVWQQEPLITEGWLTRPWQQAVLESPGLRKVIRVSRRAGKSLDVDAIVYTPTGPKKMGELKLGEQVSTPDGKSAPIIGIYPQGNLDNYKITFLDGAIVNCSLDHLWEITTADWNRTGRDRRDNPNNTRIQDTKWIIDNLPKLKSFGQAISIYATKAVAFDKQPVPLSPYLLGTILGDGYINRKGFVKLSLGDIESLDLLKNEIPESFCLKYDKQYDYKLSSKEILQNNIKGTTANLVAQAIRDLKLDGTKSATKFIPISYLYNSIETRLALLQGLMDTDGTIDKIGRLTYNTISPKLRDDVQELVWSLGGTCSISSKIPTYTYKGEKKQGKLSYSLQIFFDDSIIPFRLSRKLARIKVRNNTSGHNRVKRHIASVKLDGQKEAQCIEIDHPNHLFLTNGFIPTHNTATAIVKCLHTSFVKGRGVLVVTPLERQVAEIYNTLHKQYMDTKPDLFLPAIISDKKNPYVIQFSNGGFINFITAGTRSGGKGDAVRGQGHNVGLIYLDEADYLSDDDMASIMAIAAQDSSMEVILTSTPTGKRQYFWRMCTSPPPGWRAFHYAAPEALPNWSKAKELEFRQQYSEDSFNREFMAEFGEEATGVFNKDMVDEAAVRGQEDFPYPGMSPNYPHYGYPKQLARNPQVFRIVGVDWDKYGAGSQIIIIEAARANIDMRDPYARALDQPFDYIRVVHRREIPKSKFTLSNAVQNLVEINKEFSPDFYYLDAGYGEHQIETLQRMGIECKDPKDPVFGIHKKIVRVNFSEGVQVLDPHTKTLEKRRVKPEMVNRLVNKFDTGEMVLSPYDDELKTQLINYVVLKITQSGEPKYGTEDLDGKEHAVDALMLAVWGLYTQYGSKAINTLTKVYIEPPIGDRYMELQAQINQKKTGRPDYLAARNDDLVQENMEEDIKFAKSGMLRADAISTSSGVPSSSSTKLEQQGGFQRGGRGFKGRRTSF